MKEIDGELSTPPEIIKTWEILAPKGATLNHKIATMNIAVELHKAQAEKNIEDIQLKKLDSLHF